MQDMRCKKGNYLKHFVLPDEELKKKGYAADIIDEGNPFYMQVSTLSTYLLTKNDSRSQRYCFLLKT